MIKNLINYFLNYPRTVVFSFFIFSIIGLFLTYNFLKIDTSTDSLINKKLDFKINQKKLKDEFKVLSNNILIKISGEDINKVNLYTKELIQLLKKRNDLSFIYSPSVDPIFKENFFNFLNEKEKKNLVEKLYHYQPFFSEIIKKPRLEGFNNLLSLAIKKNDSKSLEEFLIILESFNKSIEENSKVDWFNVLNSDDIENFIIIGFKEDLKNEFEKFYTFLNSQKNSQTNLLIEFTGGLIIDYEEVKSVSKSNLIAGFLSILIVSFLLWLAFRNIKIIFFLILSILVGLSLTLAASIFIVDKLNLISVAFAVLFIGLSVDYGIQIFSRILEKNHFISKETIISDSSTISSTLLIASVPSMIGFLSFIPTNYVGLSELGTISFIGLIIGLLTNLIFLPSLLLINLKKIKFRFSENERNSYEKIILFLINRKKYIFGLILIISIFNIFFINRITFNYDALNLKDQNLESVKLAKKLIQKNPTSDYIISLVLTKDELNNSEKLDLLLQKESVQSYFSFFNLNKEYKSEDLDYLKFLINTEKSKNFFSNSNELEEFKKLLKDISKKEDLVISNISMKLFDILNKKINDKQSFMKLEQNLFEGFDDLIKKINSFGLVKKDFESMLPSYFKERYISSEGNYRLDIFPSKDVSKKIFLDEFVFDVESIYPNATGMPIIQQKAGVVVVDSFITALIISLLFLILFVYIIFRNIFIVLISLSSLLIATLLTIFLMIILNLNLNFANMIALPLLYSLGISFPIYFFKRYIDSNFLLINVIRSNTPKAIVFSAATTMGSFSTLAISSHSGTSSMGVLLFISLLMTVISTIFVLPLILDEMKKSIK